MSSRVYILIGRFFANVKYACFITHRTASYFLNFKVMAIAQPLQARLDDGQGNVANRFLAGPTPANRAAMNSINEIFFILCQAGKLVAKTGKSFSHSFQTNFYLGVKRNSLKGKFTQPGDGSKLINALMKADFAGIFKF